MILASNMNASGVPLSSAVVAVTAADPTAPSVRFSDLKAGRSVFYDKATGNGLGVDSEANYKVLLLGDTGVGKTSLIRSLTGKPFSHSMLTTVGIDFVKERFEIDSAKVCLQIWDTAGQERFRSLTKFQYRGTKGLLLVYDITNRASFETLGYWINSIEKELEQSQCDTVPAIIVGNKCDLESRRKVTFEEGQRVANRNSLFGFYETSAVDGTNIRDCFQHLAHVITDIHDPHLMSMYQYSAAIENAKRSQYTLQSDETASPPSKNTSVIKVGNEPSKLRCRCATV